MWLHTKAVSWRKQYGVGLCWRSFRMKTGAAANFRRRLTDEGPHSGLKNTLLILTLILVPRWLKSGGGLGFEFSENQAESAYNGLSHWYEELKQYFRPSSWIVWMKLLSSVNWIRMRWRKSPPSCSRKCLVVWTSRALLWKWPNGSKIVWKRVTTPATERPLRRAIMRLLEDSPQMRFYGRIMAHSRIDVDDHKSAFPRAKAVVAPNSWVSSYGERIAHHIRMKTCRELTCSTVFFMNAIGSKNMAKKHLQAVSPL